MELRGLEPLTPCLQIGLSTCGHAADLVSGLSVSDRNVPLLTGVNGTLMARCTTTVRQGISSVGHSPSYPSREGLQGRCGETDKATPALSRPGVCRHCSGGGASCCR